MLGLDGYRDHQWPARWVAPMTADPAPGLLRTRRWEPPLDVGGIPVAPASLVLRHLDTTPPLGDDGISARDRVELALEHAYRTGLVHPSALRNRRGHAPGDRLLSEVLALRGDEPATGSHAETRAVQFLRRHGLRAWRQMDVTAGGRILYVVDLVVPYGTRRERPLLLAPDHGVLFEIDGVEPHAAQVERDRRRDTCYDALGYRFVVATPNQVERREHDVLGALHRRLARPPRPGGPIRIPRAW